MKQYLVPSSDLHSLKRNLTIQHNLGYLQFSAMRLYQQAPREQLLEKGKYGIWSPNVNLSLPCLLFTQVGFDTMYTNNTKRASTNCLLPLCTPIYSFFSACSFLHLFNDSFILLFIPFFLFLVLFIGSLIQFFEYIHSLFILWFSLLRLSWCMFYPMALLPVVNSDWRHIFFTF